MTQLTLAIKRELEPRFNHLQVEGEVVNIRAQSSGHYYFSLKDQGAQISAVLFKGNARNVSSPPKAGDRVVVKGELSLYAPRGSYQIIVRELEHAGVGDLLVKLHQLKEELKKRGWLSPDHKKPLPKYPKCIGVVTSPTGSVIQDIIHVLKRRFPHFHLILNPVRVQGNEAAPEIARAIKEFNLQQNVDVMIVGRGGGSLEDLWPFNEECVAEAIFHSKIPIISAVGHETDVTLADHVADVRAPTPSAAAEISVREMSTQLDFLKRSGKQVDHFIKQKIHHLKSLVHGMRRHPFLASPYVILSDHYQRVDDFSSDIDIAIKHKMSRQELGLIALKRVLHSSLPYTQIIHLREKLAPLRSRIETAYRHLIEKKKRNLKQLAEMLGAVNPEAILKKGYCIPFKENTSSVILSSSTVEVGIGISLRFHDGMVKSRVLEVKPDNE
ncbi:MAG: exodeoxyribonuclease VII large subunit [Candidatus Neptunochlamydia sp.]|nr:exodeoxyribonuclease VII large subunit [Candidatus Neptunochlamydia sp.]